jgi:hypothetical protein
MTRRRAESLEGPAEMFPNPTSRSGAPKSDNANVDATIHTIDEWVFKKAGKPRTRAGALFHVLQLLPDSSDLARDASDGSRRHRSRLGFGGSHCFAS